MDLSKASDTSTSTRLIFSRPKTTPAPPHSPLIRTMIPSPNGELEILSAQPEFPPSKPQTPLFFAHGGFGCAAVWTSYMTLLSSAPYNIPCYSVSLRGHGASWCPSYLRMVYGTGKGALADDIVTGIRWVEAEEKRTREERREQRVRSEEERALNEGPLVRQDSGVETLDEQRHDEDCRVVLVAHSNGGGLAQIALDRGDVSVRGLVLLDSAPNFGILSVYYNWLLLDPWFGLRACWHMGHPRSPLSSTQLVKKAFFSSNMSDCLVRKFEAMMSPFESLLWPMGLLRRYVSVKRVLSGIVGRKLGWSHDSKPKILIVAAGMSRLVGTGLMERMCAEYRRGVKEYDRAEAADGLGGISPRSITAPKTLRYVEASDRVWYHVVEGAGHQLQNDEGLRDSGEKVWEDGAKQVARFWEACSA